MISPLHALGIWLLAGLFYLYEFMYRLSPSVMIPELMQDFQINGHHIGTLSAFYFYAYAALQIPVGLLLDKYPIRWLLSAACFAVAVGNLAFSVTDNIAVAYFCRALIGAGSAFSFAGCLKLSAHWFARRHFALLVGLTNLLGIFGALLGGRPWVYAIAVYGWRETLKYSAYIGFVLSLILLLGIKQPPSTLQHNKKNLPWAHYLKLFNSQQIWLIALYGCCMVAPIAAFSELWGPIFLIQKYQITRAEAVSIASMIFMGIALGGPLIGLYADRFKTRRHVMKLGTVGALITIVLAHYIPELNLFLLSGLYFLFGFFSSAMLLCFSLNTDQVALQYKATIIGFTNSIIMSGSVVLQPLIGTILDSLSTQGFQTAHYQHAFILLPLCHLLALLLLRNINEPRF